jgi:hypothetical protein
MPEARRRRVAHHGSLWTRTTSKSSSIFLLHRTMPRRATTEKSCGRPSAVTSAVIVVSSSRENASGPTGCECAISTICSRRDQIASHRARESGNATGLSDASDQRTTSSSPMSSKTSRIVAIVSSSFRRVTFA